MGDRTRKEEGGDYGQNCSSSTLHYSLDHLGVELLVPVAEQRCSDIETIPVQGELKHLRPSLHSFSVDEEGVWLFIQL